MSTFTTLSKRWVLVFPPRSPAFLPWRKYACEDGLFRPRSVLYLGVDGVGNDWWYVDGNVGVCMSLCRSPATDDLLPDAIVRVPRLGYADELLTGYSRHVSSLLKPWTPEIHEKCDPKQQKFVERFLWIVVPTLPHHVAYYLLGFCVAPSDTWPLSFVVE